MEAEKIEGNFISYWIFGGYEGEGVGILEVPNDEVALQLELIVGIIGNIRTNALKASTEGEIASAINKLGWLRCYNFTCEVYYH